MEEEKLRRRLKDVKEDAEEIGKMLERSSTTTRILDIVAAVELIDEDAVVEYHEEPEKDRHAVVVVAKEEMTAAQLQALKTYIGSVEGWHLDDRPRKNNTWKIRPH